MNTLEAARADVRRLRWLVADLRLHVALRRWAGKSAPPHQRSVAATHADRSRPKSTAELRANWLRAASRLQRAWTQYEELRRKANFNPNQPRVPAGNPDGGQWTDGYEVEAADTRPRLLQNASYELSAARRGAGASLCGQRALRQSRPKSSRRDAAGI